jgi:ubiquinone/menaquinone biosynthesis C-methylase UbiE
MGTPSDWKEQFENVYAGSPSAVYERVWREVFGDEYPEGVDPFSFVSKSELERFAADVRLGPDETLADLGCGRGGAGLWVAMATGASLIGVDIAENALAAARRRADALGVGDRAAFRRGSFEATALADSSVDAVMSVDALLFTPDKAAALRELRRVVRDGGRLAFTSWDYHRQPKGRPPQVDDHRPLLAAAGFDVLAYDETEDWRRRCAETAAGLLRNVEELAAESGSDPERSRAELEEVLANIDTMVRRVFAVAEARVPSGP